ncbi:MAG TPA: hypothetical protein VK971_03610 [Thiohalobacter sp.]|nr:hypothetical protein [Thiohalobacter sp.]
MEQALKTPYRVLADGRIVFDERQYDALARMFGAVGIDIASIETEAEYKAAFSRAGDQFFNTLIADAREGDDALHAILEAFAEGRLSDAKARLRRQTFDVIASGRDAPPQSS